MDYLINKIIEKLEDGLDRKEIRHVFFGKPSNLNDQTVREGVVCVVPDTSTYTRIATGGLDNEEHSIRIILLKAIQTEYNRDSGTDLLSPWLVRQMDGRNAQNELVDTTIRNIIRSNFRIFGQHQEDVIIEYDTDEFSKSNWVTATMTVPQITFKVQNTN